MAEQNVYQVKLKVKHRYSSVRMNPEFVQGIVLASSKDHAEEKALNYHDFTKKDPDIIFEVFCTEDLKSDFFFG